MAIPSRIDCHTAVPSTHSGLHLRIKAAFGKHAFTRWAKVSLARDHDADATGAEARIDDRVTAATGCRSYSPLEGAPRLSPGHTISL